MRSLDGRDYGARLYRFVVVADTHVNPEDARSTSPFAVNARANERAKAVFADVERWAPSFIVHVGDIVHPVPEQSTFRAACERFKAIVAGLRTPLHLVAGNHDIGDKPLDWMPAGTVTQGYVDEYRSIFGPDFYSFDKEGCHFIVLNAQTLNSGLSAENEQRIWLERDLATHRGARTFLFMHYPPFVSDRDEPSNYDNVDEPARSWLLGLIEKYTPEALFAGHVHHQWYDLWSQTEIYILPSTAFTRQDYSELFKVGPAGEYGRDEVQKLGYYLVDVHEKGHVAHFIRLEEIDRRSNVSFGGKPLESPVHTKTNVFAPVGVDMRHAWIEWLDIAATGGVQEFERKHTRSDYPALALWEMGVRKLRVPLQDLLDWRVRERMTLLKRLGHRYTAYVFGVPKAKALASLYEHRGLLDALEVILNWDGARRHAGELSELRKGLGLRVFLSKLRRKEDARHDGSRYSHFINHGFVLSERAQMEEWLRAFDADPGIDGFVLRLPWQRSAWTELLAARDLGASLRIGMAANVRIAAENPAEAVNDDARIANRVAETVFAALTCPELDVFFDSFVDVDRNYFPHHALVDRRYDPRAASYVYRQLHAALGSQSEALSPVGMATEGGIQWFHAKGVSGTWVLLLAANGGTVGELRIPSAPSAVGTSVSWLELGTGTKWSGRVIGGALKFERQMKLDAPVLLHVC